MAELNPYQATAENACMPSVPSRPRQAVVAVVLLSSAFLVYKIITSLPGLMEDPGATEAGAIAILVIWCVWIVVELLAARLVWRGVAAGKWILVISFAIKAIGQGAGFLMAWPVIARTPFVALSPPWVFYALQCILYLGLVLWLLLTVPGAARTIQK